MKAWRLEPGKGPDSLQLTDGRFVPLATGQARVKVRAVSLNARDLMVAAGQYPGALADSVVPASDAAGEVIEVADGETRIAVGARVGIAWNPAHLAGPLEPWMMNETLGALRDGVLAEEIVVDAGALVALPDTLDFEQAACLPCAGVTAWNALFEAGPLVPGQTVLTTGTGGLSLIAVALAKSAGARVGITSSDDARLERAREVGADFGVNYRDRGDWDVAVRELTGGRGADVVLENAGPPSVATSVKAAAPGGRICQIGWKGLDGPPLSVIDLAMGGVSLVPIQAGSRHMLDRLVRAVAANGIEIPVHSTHAFDEVPAAFAALANGDAFGKVVIRGR